MRLLKIEEDGSLSLTGDLSRQIPPYAILSHTWGADEDEVAYANVMLGTAQVKKGYAKLEFCARQAQKDGLQYMWVDTCCIDKTNSVELSEAITSMFRWYAIAEKCYVYLSDLSLGEEGAGKPRYLWEADFRACRWHTRGFTLQELLAPASVEFYTADQIHLGSKSSLEFLLSDVTGIPLTALRGRDLSYFPVDERLRWAAGRETKKVEDEAYCLLGIFGVFMPLIYGEGENAWTRLRQSLRSDPARIQWTVPYQPNPVFIGREHELGELCSAIQNAVCSNVRRQHHIVVTGPTLSGKSELCYQAIHHMRHL